MKMIGYVVEKWEPELGAWVNCMSWNDGWNEPEYVIFRDRLEAQRKYREVRGNPEFDDVELRVAETLQLN